MEGLKKYGSMWIIFRYIKNVDYIENVVIINISIPTFIKLKFQENSEAASLGTDNPDAKFLACCQHRQANIVKYLNDYKGGSLEFHAGQARG